VNERTIAFDPLVMAPELLFGSSTANLLGSSVLDVLELLAIHLDYS